MFKKLLVAAAILASSSVAFAAAPYVGASVGLSDTQIGDFGGRNPNFNIFGGYGAMINQSIYLGGEAFVGKATGEIDNFSTLSNRYIYGASFIPGLMLSEHTMIYARAGLDNASYDVFGDDETITGVQAGLGMQVGLTQNLDLRGEYVYSNYNAFKGNDVKPTNDQFNLGLVYKFE